MMRSFAGLVTAVLLGGCIAAPKVDHSALPYYAYVPLRDGGIEDARAPFAGTFCALLSTNPEFSGRPCADFLHLDAEPVAEGFGSQLNPDLPFKLIIVPGFLGDCLASYTTPFETARQTLLEEGVESELLTVSGRASSRHNAPMIASRLAAEELKSGPPVVLIGYSKGVADILEALALLGDDVDHIAAVVSVAGVVNGTPLADDQSAFTRWFVDRLPLAGCAGSGEDGDAIASLTYEYRQAWLESHPLPSGLRYFSIAAFGSLEQMSSVNRPTYRMLSRIDARNDGQIIYRDALIPNSTLLALARADHLAVALPIDSDDGLLLNQAFSRNEYPRSELFKALLISLQHLLEDPL